MAGFFKKMSPARIIALGFAAVILLGSALLMLPCCVRGGDGLSYIDSLYTATSAVCVTGLVTVDTAATFTFLGQAIIIVLIQIGGLGVATIGAGVLIAMGRKMDIKSRFVIKEAVNLSTGKGIVTFIRSIFFTTLLFELCGAALSFIVFIRDFPFWKALWVSVFHSISAFNNAGFDILGNMQSLSAYKGNVLLNLVTCALIICGGLGFPVLRELRAKGLRRHRKFSLHAKAVLFTSAVLIIAGTLLLKLTENISWLGAFFQSVTTRTAGFSTYSLGEFSKAGLIVMMFLMFIGASPASTGGGIKTTTLFVLLTGVKSAATNRSRSAFHYSVPEEKFRKAAVIMLISAGVVMTGTYLFCIFEPELAFTDVFFETVSAFSTSGLSTGITPQLGTAAKILSICIMYIGRLGVLTVATIWSFSKGERVSYPDGNIAVG